MVEKLSGGSASLLVRCSFAPFWGEGEIFLDHRSFSSFFGCVCVLERNNEKRGIERFLLLNLITGVLSKLFFTSDRDNFLRQTTSHSRLVLNTCRTQDAVERQGRLENVWFRRQSF